MELARLTAAKAKEVLTQAAHEDAPQPKGGGDPVLAFSRIACAVRMTVGLHAKIRKDQKARADRQAAEQAIQAAEDFEALEVRRRQGRLRRAMSHYIVTTAIEAEERDAPEVERLIEEAHRRYDALAPNRDVADFADIDVKETAATIARSLGVDPGPDCWTNGWRLDAPPQPPEPPPAPPRPPPFAGSAPTAKREPSLKDRLRTGASPLRYPP
jgi:hypothetical protein